MESTDRALVNIGTWSRLEAQVLRARLESAGIPVLAEYDTLGFDARAVLLVPGEHADFARAVVNELDVTDEVPDTSPEAYLWRIEEHLDALGRLVAELRTRLDGCA